MKIYPVQVLTIIILASFISHSVKSEFFTSISDLERLLQTEEAIVKSLENYLQLEEERLKKVKWLSKQYEDMFKAANHDVETFLSNPVNAFLLVKRLTADWELTNRLTDGSSSRAALNEIISQPWNFPNQDDLSGAAVALLRLQEIYLLNTTSIARGRIPGTSSSSVLSAGDCYDLGRYAFAQTDFNHSILWMQESLDRVDSEDIRTANKLDILNYMAAAHFSLSNYSSAVQLAGQIIEIDPRNPAAFENFLVYREHLENEDEIKKTKKQNVNIVDQVPEGYLHPDIVVAYERLCRGEVLKTPKEESKLHCHYTTNNNSYLLLQPAKVEVLNLEPRLVIYHDVINAKEAKEITSFSAPKLARSTGRGKKGVDITISFRISKSAWLFDNEHSLIPHINTRITDISGLDLESAEPMQVLNYGIGGHYEPHNDYVKEGDFASYLPKQGNRMATWIFYLSDVPAGGYTVFPKINAAVKPIKGSAAFWYNLRENGTGIPETLHAACPVLAGSKWVMNKWIHEFQNEFKRPCSLDRFE